MGNVPVAYTTFVPKWDSCVHQRRGDSRHFQCVDQQAYYTISYRIKRW